VKIDVVALDILYSYVFSDLWKKRQHYLGIYTSYFLLPTSYFLPPTPYYLLPKYTHLGTKVVGE
jgi:hypothetical protein